MLKLNNNSWEKLPTTYHSTQLGNSIYIASTSGFSTFAVVGSKVVEEESKSKDKAELPWILIVGFIVAVIVLLIFILFKAKFIYFEDIDTDEK